ncbi:MAG TPA: Yip1 family protein [Candidatus Obscuribacter sp.]|nr:Yip1 family protein [Candidatus Obscuribacter sp.]HNG77604.1 Yip1 family protein [Candidatus Obscuribacter sp.]
MSEAEKPRDEMPEAELEKLPDPEKRIVDSKPFELELAFRQVLREPEGKVETNTNKSVQLPAEEEAQTQVQALPEPGEGQKKSQYENSFNLFADIFYGVLVAPRQTMLILSDQTKYPCTAGNIAQSGFFVIMVLSMTGWLRFKADSIQASVGSGLMFTLSGALNWFFMAVVLYYLSIFMRGRLKLGNALIATAWSFLPFIFFAPVLCFRTLLGNFFPLLAMMPALWFLFLLFVTFQASLRTSIPKLSLILIVVPPLFAFVYIFWLVVAFGSLFIQILPRLLPAA